jgi:hypothetical protein
MGTKILAKTDFPHAFFGKSSPARENIMMLVDSTSDVMDV